MNESIKPNIGKVLLLGDTSGKTSLLRRYIDNKFSEQYRATIGMDFYTKTFEIKQEKFRLQYWEGAAQARYRAFSSTVYRTMSAIVLVFALNDIKSFNSIPTWMEEARESANDNLTMILIGNMCDKPDRQVPYDQAKSFADCYGMKYFETSAKLDINVSEALNFIAKIVKIREDCKEKMKKLKENGDIFHDDVILLSRRGSMAKNEKKCCN